MGYSTYIIPYLQVYYYYYNIFYIEESVTQAMALSLSSCIARATEPCVGYSTYIIPYLKVYSYYYFIFYIEESITRAMALSLSNCSTGYGAVCGVWADL